jgi:RHS repeat-associated protein
MIIVPLILSVLGAFGSASPDNHPPIAVDDSYSIHNPGYIGSFDTNDSDPDGDSLRFSILTQPAHGTLQFDIPEPTPRPWYTPATGFSGTDSLVYQICDPSNACATATVTINVVNQAPIAADDSYSLHNPGYIGSFDSNDRDPDGDGLRFSIVTPPAHGTLLFDLPEPTPRPWYTPDTGYAGPDSLVYRICDAFNACASATVAINVTNQTPIAGNDNYDVSGPGYIGPFDLNDRDPDGDGLTFAIVTGPSHGALAFDGGVPGPRPMYTPETGYAGLDTLSYKICDRFNACATATVTLKILVKDGAQDYGTTSCEKAVAQPINVTNGNMYLQETDYQLPGAGPTTNITRTYNSLSQSVGLFGRGWSSDYDESIKIYSGTYVRWFRADGQATNFTRSSASGPFLPVEGDFHGSLAQNGDGTFAATFLDGSIHRFTSAGKLLSLVDTNGNQTTLNYTNGKLASITDPFARVVTATTDTSGRVLTLTDSIGKFATYVYGPAGEMLSVTYADNSKFQFSYTGSPTVLASVTDALGNILESHTYDAQGRALTSEKQGGVERVTLTYVDETETDVTDALGHLSKYFVDKTRGRNIVTQIQGLCSCGSGSHTQTWTYDNQLNVTSHTNALGQTSTYVYDANGNKVSATGVLGTSSFTYNQLGEVLTATDAMGGVTTNTYDAAGHLLSATNALNNTTTFTYDARGELLTMTSARGKVTTLAYDTKGNVSQTTDALANVTKFGYDARGRVISATDALNNVTTYSYDLAGRLNKITRADASIITFTYDLAGRRTKVTDALGNITSFAYDGAYRLTGQTDALTKSVSYSYDLMSNLIATTDQLGHTTSVTYDEFNRPKTITYPPAVAGGARLQETTEYDALGNVTKRTDTAGRVTTLEYDDANRVVKITDPALQVTQYEYNARSNVTAVIDALSQRYAFDYDALGRVISTTRAGLQMTYAYDAVGNPIRRTDYNNMLTLYTYDTLNRLTKITYPDASVVSYAYDKLSQMTTATNINGTVSFAYDKVHRVTSTTDVWGQAINYTYDGNDRRMQMSFGKTKFAAYAYDAVNRLTKITDNSNKITSYTYDAAGNALSRTLPNGVVTNYSYDGLDRLTRLKDAKGTSIIADNQYSYNSAGEIMQNIDQSGVHAYGYDAVDRLTSASYPATGNEAYAYDAVGNRTSSHRSANYGYQPFNRLTSTDTASYLYDNNGNLTSKSTGTGTTQFQWDYENRLTQVVTPSSGSATYKYDALGRRIQRAPSNGASANFTYDDQDVVRDKNSDGTTVDYLNGPGVDNKIWQKGATQYYFSQDHLGSTTALTNTSGVLVERETYDAYGNSNASANTRYGYTGRERDSLTGLMYYRARWYDAQVGRFISEDPIGLSGGMNQFAYVHSNPQNSTDPSGLFDIDVHYYLTYYLARHCFSDSEARQIAEGDQRSDEDEDKLPGLGYTPSVGPGGGIDFNDWRQQRANIDFHAFGTPAQNAKRANQLYREAVHSGDLFGFGTYLHFLQDEFSHVGFVGNPTTGHVSRGNRVDHTNYDVEWTMEMAHATWDKMKQFGRNRGCNCKGDMTDPDWKTVRDFADLGYNQSSRGGRFVDFWRHVSDDQLRRKIQILDLPWRSQTGR